MRADRHDDAPPPEIERELEAIDAALEGAPPLTDLGRLALELRDERPEPRPAWAGELDRRVTAGFERPGGGASWWKRRIGAQPMLPLGALASVLLVLTLSIAVLSSNRGDDESESAGGGVAASEELDSGGGGASGADESPVIENERQAAPQPASGGAEPASSLAPPLPPVPGDPRPGSDGRRVRKVERSASLNLVAQPEQIERVAAGVVRITDSVGGFVVTSSVSTGDGGTFELRVPSRRLQQALAELSKLAHVAERNQATTDITAQHVSARERLQDARAERRSLLRRLAAATTDDEAASLRARLRTVSAQIARAKAALASVRNRAAFSTVAVTLTADPEPGGADEGAWTPGDALDDAVRVLEVVAGVALVSLAVLLPLSLLVLVGWGAAQWAARRRRERALDAV